MQANSLGHSLSCMKHVILIMGVALASLQMARLQSLPEPTPSENIAKPEASPIAAISYVGVWSMLDEQGQSFDMVVFSNGQVVSTRTKNTSGALGERGFWRVDNRELVAFFDDGWTVRLVPFEDAFIYRGFPPDSTVSQKESPAVRVVGDAAAFVGIWRLNKEPDGSYLYIVLQSCGQAFSTIASGTQGKWESTKEGALCSWPDGWTDLIFASPEGYQKRSWVGAAKENITPSDISPAIRVGEAKFSIAP